MKTKTLLQILVSLFLAVLAYWCQDEDKYTYEILSPVYMEFDEFRAPLKSFPAFILCHPKMMFDKDSSEMWSNTPPSFLVPCFRQDISVDIKKQSRSL